MTRGAWVLIGAVSLGLLPSQATAQLRAQVVATGLVMPVAFVVDPLDPSTFYVVEQRGTIRTLRNGTLSATLFLDLRRPRVSAGDQGLLGFAFSPDPATTGRFFVNFTNPQGDTVVARFRRNASGVV